MLTITAIIRVKTGAELAMRDALLVVAGNVLTEPQTIGFFVSQHSVDPRPLTTCECLANQAEMSRHHGPETVARFYGTAVPLLRPSPPTSRRAVAEPALKSRPVVPLLRRGVRAPTP